MSIILYIYSVLSMEMGQYVRDTQLQPHKTAVFQLISYLHLLHFRVESKSVLDLVFVILSRVYGLRDTRERERQTDRQRERRNKNHDEKTDKFKQVGGRL